ncbi:MAG: GFA family protein, partial [Paracoccaceae bacterium]
FKRRDLVTPVVRHFCLNCGTAIGNKSPTNPNLMIVKIGTFDDQSFFTPMLAIFTCDKQSYHYIPEGIPTFEKRREKS